MFRCCTDYKTPSVCVCVCVQNKKRRWRTEEAEGHFFLHLADLKLQCFVVPFFFFFFELKTFLKRQGCEKKKKWTQRPQHSNSDGCITLCAQAVGSSLLSQRFGEQLHIIISLPKNKLTFWKIKYYDHETSQWWQLTVFHCSSSHCNINSGIYQEEMTSSSTGNDSLRHVIHQLS